MKLTFIGADHEVTGSCHLLQAAGKNILVDYGMEQGSDTYLNEPLPIMPGEIDYVLLTHAHIDHSGLLPLLVKRGFRGEILATKATCDLVDIMLLDSAHIQEFEAEWRNRKGMRKGEPMVEPIYTTEDAMRTTALLHEYDYDQIYALCDGIKVRFTDIGHLLGSSAIEVWIEEEGIEKKIVFSGDVGNLNQPIIRDPQAVAEADYLLIESTYGDRSHGPRVNYVEELAKVLQRTFDRGGNVVIPSFAVGRTQEMLYFLRQIKEQHLISGHGDFTVYVDSPLAVHATTIFNEHMDCFDADAADLVQKGINPISFKGLRLSITSEESKEINFDDTPKVILSASGMCEAGRIKHHLKHNLWRPECTVLFVGYQAVGTLGRSLVEGKKEVKLFGESIQVAAEICQLPGVSGHADREGLLRWASLFEKKPEKVFVVHGEDSVTQIFADTLHEELGLDADAPYSGTIYDLAAGTYIKVTEGVPAPKKETAGVPGTPKKVGPYVRLANTADRLLAIIKNSENVSNKDLARFADQLAQLCDKWERV
ncbi:MAG: MBL fold metallo-hydrolase [Lachnospiraceae bacterium]|nr:MBL fold metallo-hydrolase [Lachnospiraceae bacterium]